jgi:hypothetical protein
MHGPTNIYIKKTREIVKLTIDKHDVFHISVKSDDRAVETGQ